MDYLVIVVIDDVDDSRAAQRAGVERLSTGGRIERGAVQYDASSVCFSAHNSRVKGQQVRIGVIQSLGVHRLISSMSRYFSPEPVLNRTTLSDTFRNPESRNLR